MYKTIFLVRDGALDSMATAEWPEHVTNEAVQILSSLREERGGDTLEEIVGEEVVALCEAFHAMQFRAQFNMLKQPYVLNTEDPPTGEELLAYASEQQKEKQCVEK